MRIETGGSLRTWGQWIEQSRDMQRAKERAIIEAMERKQATVQPLDGNVVGGPLDGARIPNGTRDGLAYEWDGKRWRHVR